MPRVALHVGGWTGAADIVLEPGGNLAVSLQDSRQPNAAKLQPNPDATARDLLDVAAAYYRSDELLPRSEAPDAWSRDIRLSVPVADPGAWAPAAATVHRIAAFLSGDNLRLQTPKVRQAKDWYTGPHRRGIPTGFDVACLFSGGMDSLSGALGLLDSGKRVLLVSHIGDNNTAGYQQRAFGALKKEFGQHVEMVRLSVRGEPRAEPSHRSRSFLFLSTAAFIAQQGAMSDIVLPENGLLSLNLPLDESRTGSYSTRTAHPAFLADFQRLLGQLGLEGIRIRNPHAASTKAEVIRPVIKGREDLFLRTTSCSNHGRPFAKTRVVGSTVDYCGRCMPCIQRSIALHAVGLDGKPKLRIGDDLVKLNGRRARNVDVANIFPMARLANSLRDLGNEALAARILSHGHFDTDQAAHLAGVTPSGLQPWMGMLRTWVKEFDAYTDDFPAASKRLLGLPVA